MTDEEKQNLLDYTTGEDKINILGTEYSIVYENFGRDNRDGYVDIIHKVIHIDNRSSEEYIKHVLRHEIIHSFFFESGLEEYWNDEKLVSWIAMQFDKIVKVFNEVEK